jgi:hypothetical protein
MACSDNGTTWGVFIFSPGCSIVQYQSRLPPIPLVATPQDERKGAEQAASHTLPQNILYIRLTPGGGEGRNVFRVSGRGHVPKFDRGLMLPLTRWFCHSALQVATAKRKIWLQ